MINETIQEDMSWFYKHCIDADVMSSLKRYEKYLYECLAKADDTCKVKAITKLISECVLLYVLYPNIKTLEERVRVLNNFDSITAFTAEMV